jgi:hypothetical protein
MTSEFHSLAQSEDPSEAPIPDSSSEEQAEAALDLMHGIALALIGPPEEEDDPEAEELVEAEIAEVSSIRPGFGPGAGRPATIIRLSVEPSEMEQIVGRQGRTAHSLRVILNAVGVRHGRRYMLEIVELPEFPEFDDEVDEDDEDGEMDGEHSSEPAGTDPDL